MVHHCQAGDLFGDKNCLQQSEWSRGALRYTDIDNDHFEPQMCTTYAADIYEHLRVAEVSLWTFVSPIATLP